MITKIINCKKYYEIEKKKLILSIDNCIKLYKKNPKLTIITTENHFAKNLYIKNKIKLCIETKTEIIIFKTCKNIKNESTKKIIKILNNDKKINGIIIQFPIQSIFFKNKTLELINKINDIDFINPKNLGIYISKKEEYITPPSFKSIENIIEKKKIKIKGLKILLIGFSNIIGKPIAHSLFKRGSKITITNKYDNKFKKLIRNNDIILTAIGKKKHIKKNNFPIGGIIIDIGINKTKKKLIIGDVMNNKNINKISFITPVPNGIGLLTVLNLIKNNYKLFLFQNKIDLK